MSMLVGSLGRTGGSMRRRLTALWAGISAVSIKELRGRMRGRRAFVVLTVYLLLLSLFAFAIYAYLKQQAAQLSLGSSGSSVFPPDFRGGGWWPGATQSGTALSASIGHGIFGGLLLVETLLVMVLAPAFTTGAISLEREKQTLDLLVTTPLSTLGMVIGKLFSALVYVLLLIVASIPLASLVFVFGAVGPEDLVRGYAFLFALAFGMGALGLFVSALVKRTQTATVVTFVLVLVLSIGTVGVHQFWTVAGGKGALTTTDFNGNPIVVQPAQRPPEALLWLNPFVADLDMICATAPDTYHLSCAYISSVTGRPYNGSPSSPIPFGAVEGDAKGGGFAGVTLVVSCPPNARCAAPMVDPNAVAIPDPTTQFGFPRDTFWPKSAAAFLVLGVLLTLLSAQLVSPTRRLRLIPARLRVARLRQRADKV